MSQTQTKLLRMSDIVQMRDRTRVSRGELVRCLIPSFAKELEGQDITLTRCWEILEMSEVLKDSGSKSNLLRQIHKTIDILFAKKARAASTLQELEAIREEGRRYSEDGLKRLNAAGRARFGFLLKEKVKDKTLTLSDLANKVSWTIDHWCPKDVKRSVEADFNRLLRKELRLPGVTLEKAVEIYHYQAATQATKNLAVKVMTKYF